MKAKPAIRTKGKTKKMWAILCYCAGQNDPHVFGDLMAKPPTVRTRGMIVAQVLVPVSQGRKAAK